jgi:fucose permease
LSGAGIGSLIVAIGWGNGSGAVLLAVVFLAMAIFAALNLLPTKAPPPGAGPRGPRFTLPDRAVLGVGIISFLAFAGEGAVTDWSALFLVDVKHASTASAGLGYAVFSVAMTVCRLAGDAVVARLGGFTTVLAGGGMVAAGMVLAIAAPSPLLSSLAFAIVGVGAANLVPVAFSAAARIPGVSPAAGVAAATTLGYSGFLIFPPLIGFVARAFGLSAALITVAIMAWPSPHWPARCGARANKKGRPEGRPLPWFLCVRTTPRQRPKARRVPPSLPCRRPPRPSSCAPRR